MNLLFNLKYSTMKKTIFRSMLAIGMIAAAPLMNSCNRDDDNSPAPPQQLGNAQINPEAAKDGYMILVTKKAVGQQMTLGIDAPTADQGKVWIDLNNDGIQQTQEKAVGFDKYQNYTLGAQTVVIYGKVTVLNCRENQLQALEVTKNTALEWLSCRNNQLQALDISKNTALEWLDCSSNLLTALDISKNTALKELDCSVNQMKKAAMNTLLGALPVRQAVDKARVAIREEGKANEGNELPDVAQIQAAKAKNWKVGQLKNGGLVEL